MRQFIIVFTVFVFLSGCAVIKRNDLNAAVDQPIENVESLEVEQALSYQDIVTKINDINISKSNNKRVREIIKEYHYNVSDDDSKNSARKKALNQVKILILEEIGVYVESYLELNTLVKNKVYQKTFKQEIKNFTAGIIKTKIIDETYDGDTYFLKASVLVDADSVSEGITEILKIKANKSEISKLTKLLKSKEKEIDMRSSETIRFQKKIASQELLNIAKEKELKITKTQLNEARLELKKFESEEIKLQGELGGIRKKVNLAMQRIQKQSKEACLVNLGMTISEVKNSIGRPTGVDVYCNQEVGSECRSLYLYGKVRLYFDKNTKTIEHIRGC